MEQLSCSMQQPGEKMASMSVTLLHTTRLIGFLLAVNVVVLAQATSSSPVPPAQMPPGQLVENVVCNGDAAQSYALYLPLNYSPARQWPILYAFDPGAHGQTPVERFKEAAEKYGWIVVGSNNSRNGPMQPSAYAFKMMWQDTHERFAIAEGRTYTTGFSGGARVATTLAMVCPDCVAGVIACGAGFPIGLKPSSSMHFAFFATAGVDDFNFAEVKNLEPDLSAARLSYRIEEFPGRHEWLPAWLASKSIAGLEIQAIKSGKKQRDDPLLHAIRQSESQQARTLEESKQPYDAYRIYAGLVQSFTGLRDVNEIEKKVSLWRDSREIKAAVRDEGQQIREQRNLENQANALFAERETTVDTFEFDGRVPGF